MPKVHIRWRDIFFLAIGAIISTVANNWTYFTFSKEIGIDDLFTAIIGGGIGLYVGSRLTSKVSSDRVEKDLILSIITSLRSAMQDLFDTVESGSVSLVRATSLVKLARQPSFALKDMVNVCYNDQEDIIKLVDEIILNLRGLNHILTGGTIIGGNVDINPILTGVVNTHNNIINDRSLQLIIKVNRL